MILVLNCGSQSIKWKLFDDELKLAQKGESKVLDSNNYEKKIEEELKKISLEKISLIGHRMVHSGQKYKKPTKITEAVLKELEKLNYLAPLHNPYNILGIKVCKNIFSDVSNTVVFDTEFFSDLPEKAFTYALPEDIKNKFGYRRFGFHGISHEYVANEGAKKINKPFNRLKIITCHLGGGASIVAIKNGKAIDTSMGFSPTEGLVMMTRSGDVDNEIILEMAKNYGVEETKKIINLKSGFQGICQSGDMLEVLDKIKNGDKSAKLALDIFTYQIKKYIGAYFAILGGCDLLVFTGAIGFGSEKIRNMITKDLSILKMPTAKSSSMRDEKSIGTKILAIKTDEELAIGQKIIKTL